jgi:hypothetical protein
MLKQREKTSVNQSISQSVSQSIIMNKKQNGVGE